MDKEKSTTTICPDHSMIFDYSYETGKIIWPIDAGVTNFLTTLRVLVF